MKKIVAIITTLLCSIALTFPISMTNVFAHSSQQAEFKKSAKSSFLYETLEKMCYSADGNFSKDELNSQQFHKMIWTVIMDVNKKKIIKTIEFAVCGGKTYKFIHKESFEPLETDFDWKHVEEYTQNGTNKSTYCISDNGEYELISSEFTKCT